MKASVEHPLWCPVTSNLPAAQSCRQGRVSLCPLTFLLEQSICWGCLGPDSSQLLCCRLQGPWDGAAAGLALWRAGHCPDVHPYLAGCGLFLFSASTPLSTPLSLSTHGHLVRNKTRRGLLKMEVRWDRAALVLLCSAALWLG